jgi:hypothetical protein
MREVRARECAGRRDLGRSDHVEVPAQTPREQERILERLKAPTRWLDE